jgi:proteasome lid subunit RPN8/RPN11
MNLILSADLLSQIEQQAATSYPEECAGLLLGHLDGKDRRVTALIPLPNTFDEGQRSRRYLISPQAMIQADQEAEARGLDILGVFHSHPDHPAQPSEFDRTWAWPWFIYLITSVAEGKAVDHRAWLLADDRSALKEIQLQLKHIQEVS